MKWKNKGLVNKLYNLGGNVSYLPYLIKVYFYNVSKSFSKLCGALKCMVLLYK